MVRLMCVDDWVEYDFIRFGVWFWPRDFRLPLEGEDFEE